MSVDPLLDGLQHRMRSSDGPCSGCDQLLDGILIVSEVELVASIMDPDSNPTTHAEGKF